MSPSKRILIVEDEPNVRLVFRAALSLDAYILVTAEDGETAQRFQKQAPADLILLDLNMPCMGGMEFLRRLRESGDDVPVVIVSAHDSTPNVVQAMRLGAIDFLSKPPTPESLRKVVAEVLARAAVKPAKVEPVPSATPEDDLMVQAKQALNHREFSRAETLLGSARRRPDLAAEACYLIGILHELRDEKDAAFRAYQASLQANPKFEPARLHLMKYFNDRLM
ncbi:MAG: phoB [Planctomycetota bacterium]|nr:phoB [Planctomycetota bacterium]